jgi:hypothetical protein
MGEACRVEAMPRFEIETAYPDGYTCERHLIQADSVEEACEIAIQRSGDAEEAWTVVEAGDTFVSSVMELRGSQRIVCTFPERFNADAETQYLQEKIDRLTEALMVLFAETSQWCEPETRILVKKALSTNG